MLILNAEGECTQCAPSLLCKGVTRLIFHEKHTKNNLRSFDFEETINFKVTYYSSISK